MSKNLLSLLLVLLALMPTMNVMAADGYEVVGGTTTDENYPVSNVADGKTETYWETNQETGNEVIFHVTDAKKTSLSEYKFTYYYYLYTPPKNWQIYGSCDQKNWTLIDSKTGITDHSTVADKYTIIPFSLIPINYTYYKFVIDSNSDGCFGLAELELILTEPAAYTTNDYNMDFSDLPYGYYQIDDIYSAMGSLPEDLSKDTRLKGDSALCYVFANGTRNGVMTGKNGKFELEERTDKLYKEETGADSWLLQRVANDTCLYTLRSYANGKWLKFKKDKALAEGSVVISPTQISQVEQGNLVIVLTTTYDAGRDVLLKNYTIKGYTEVQNVPINQAKFYASKDSSTWVLLNQWADETKSVRSTFTGVMSDPTYYRYFKIESWCDLWDHKFNITEFKVTCAASELEKMEQEPSIISGRLDSTKDWWDWPVISSPIKVSQNLDQAFDNNRDTQTGWICEWRVEDEPLSIYFHTYRPSILSNCNIEFSSECCFSNSNDKYTTENSRFYTPGAMTLYGTNDAITWTQLATKDAGSTTAFDMDAVYSLPAETQEYFTEYKLVFEKFKTTDEQKQNNVFAIRDITPTVTYKDVFEEAQNSIVLTDTLTDDCIFTMTKGKSSIAAMKADGTTGTDVESYTFMTPDKRYDTFWHDGRLCLKLQDDTTKFEPFIISEAYFHLSDPLYVAKEDTISRMIATTDSLTAAYKKEHPDKTVDWVHAKTFPYEQLPTANFKHFSADIMKVLDERIEIARPYYTSLYNKYNVYLALDTLKHWLPVSSSKAIGTYDQDARDEALYDLQLRYDSLQTMDQAQIKSVKQKAWRLRSNGTKQLYFLKAKDKSGSNTYYLNSNDKALELTTSTGLHSIFQYGTENDMQNIIDRSYLDVDNVEFSEFSNEVHVSHAFDNYRDSVKTSGTDLIMYSLDKYYNPCHILYLDGGKLSYTDTYPNADSNIQSACNWTMDKVDGTAMDTLINDEMRDILSRPEIPGTLDHSSDTYKWLYSRYETLKDATNISADDVIEFNDAYIYAKKDASSMIMPKKGFYRLQTCANTNNDYLTAEVGDSGLKLANAKTYGDANSTLFFCDYKSTEETKLSTPYSYLINYDNGLFCNGTTTAYVGERRPWTFELGYSYGTVAASYGGLYYGVENDHTKTVKEINETSSWKCTPVNEVKVKLPSNGVMAFSCALPVVIPEGLKAVIVTEDDNGQHLVALKGDTLTANTGCFLTGTPSDNGYTLKITEKEPTLSDEDLSALSISMLKPAPYTEMLSVIQEQYKLDNDTIYMINMETSTQTAFYTQIYSGDTAGRKLVHGFQTYLVKPLNGIMMKSKITFMDYDDLAGINDVNTSTDSAQAPDGKFLKDGKLYIRRNGKIYSADGTIIK